MTPYERGGCHGNLEIFTDLRTHKLFGKGSPSGNRSRFQFSEIDGIVLHFSGAGSPRARASGAISLRLGMLNFSIQYSLNVSPLWISDYSTMSKS